jgi:hypothetical protein
MGKKAVRAKDKYYHLAKEHVRLSYENILRCFAHGKVLLM